MDSHNLDLPDTDSYDEELSTDNRARRRWPLAAAVVIVALAAVAGGVAVAGNFRSADLPPAAASTATMMAPTASASLTTTPSPTTATPVSVPPPASTAPATEGAASEIATGDTSVLGRGLLQACPPAGPWRNPRTGSADYPGTKIIVFNEARMQVAELYHGATGGVGGACGPGTYKMTKYTPRRRWKRRGPRQAACGFLTACWTCGPAGAPSTTRLDWSTKTAEKSKTAA